jgi:hypothetical protein
MSVPVPDSLTQQGIIAAKAGNRAQAQELLKAALARDEHNLVAWWWFSRVQDDPKVGHKIEDHAREVAVLQGEQGLETYRALLQEARVPVLLRYTLDSQSKSLGSTCPIDTEQLKTGDMVVICPTCHTPHHSECWRCNAYHCGNYGCNTSGLIDLKSQPQTELAVASRTLVLDARDIPQQTPWADRETQEAQFRNRYQNALFGAVLQQLMMEQQARTAQARAREVRAIQEREERERRQRELAALLTRATLAGLVPGILLAIAAFQRSHSWTMALFAVYLTATSISTATGHAFGASDKLVSIVYWLLPRIVAAGTMLASFGLWSNGLVAVVLASVIGLFLVERLLRSTALYRQRAFIAYSALALAGIVGLRWVVSQLR